MSERLKEQVFTALDNALANGYDPRALTAEQNVIDLISYDADLESQLPLDLIPLVIEWLKQHLESTHG